MLRSTLLQLLAGILMGWGAAIAAFISEKDYVLQVKHTAPGEIIKASTSLRILCVGDSITAGALSQGPEMRGNGYRTQLLKDLSGNDVDFVGMETGGTMADNAFAAWPGQTIQYITKHVPPSLKQRPNIILVHAGTNDMDSNPGISKQGDKPSAAASRLGALVDEITKACPDAVVLVAVIIGSCNAQHAGLLPAYQRLIPGVVRARYAAGKHVLAANFSAFPRASLQGCVHPTPAGYDLLGNWWYDAVAQIPRAWIHEPVPLSKKMLQPQDDKSGQPAAMGSGLAWKVLVSQALLLLTMAYW